MFLGVAIVIRDLRIRRAVEPARRDSSKCAVSMSGMCRAGDFCFRNECSKGDPMLHELLSTNRAELIERCGAKAANRCTPQAEEPHLRFGISHFIDQLITALHAEQAPQPPQTHKVVDSIPTRSEITVTAAQHGRELFQHGFKVDQVVHDYGDLCQAVTELALQNGQPIRTEEFHTFNRCLDDAIAVAVTEYSHGHDVLIAEQGMRALNERLAILAHALRGHLHTASHALIAIKSGSVGVGSSTAAVLERSLIELRSLVDRSLADVRVTPAMPARHQVSSVADIIGEIKISAALEAQARKCRFTVSVVDPRLEVNADRDLLISAVGNLLQNAFKFTPVQSEVSLHAYAAADRVLIEVEDSCGGLPPSEAEAMFLPFVQNDAGRSRLGLGLSISRRNVEANDGVLTVRDLPGSGCIFTIDLPLHSVPGPIGVNIQAADRLKALDTKIATLRDYAG
jgi:signal transduction histidine kinase